MKRVLTSSRGEGLEPYLPADVTVSSTKGGKLEDLAKDALSELPPPYGRTTKRTHFYFVCGVPNVSRLVKNYDSGYRECIYDAKPEETA